MRQAVIVGWSWAALVFTFMGIGALIQPGGWEIHLVVLPLLVLGAMWGVMALARHHRLLGSALAAVAGLAVWVVYLLGLTGDAAGIRRLIPAPGAWRALAAHLQAAVAALPEYGRPAENPDLFAPLGLAGLGPVCVIVGWLVLVARRPVWVGLPVAACWVVFLTGGPKSSLGWVLAAGVAYLVIVALAPRPGQAPRRFTAIAVPLLAVGTLMGLIAALVAPLLPGWGGSTQLTSFWDGNYADATGLTVGGPIPVGDQLRSQANVTLFTTTDYAGPLKMGSLWVFDGTSWQWQTNPLMPYNGGIMGDGAHPSGGTSTVFNTDGTVGTVTPVTPLPPAPQWQPGPALTVTIDQLRGHTLPVTQGPRTVTGLSPLEYDQVSDSLSTGVRLGTADTYEIQPLVLDRTDLGTMAPARDAIGPGSTYAPWPVAHLPEIKALTAGVIGHATTQGQMLDAIQAYLTGPGFRYTLSPRWQATADPVWDFLTHKEGYCVHYATAMAIMASTMGIYMRVSVGYLPGSLQADGTRSVTGSQAHLWPEAYFPNIGWVAYEPTPGVGTAVVNGAQPSEAPSETPTPSDTPAAETTPTTGPGQTGTTTTDQARTVTRVAWVGGGLAGAGLIVLIAWLVYTRTYSPERAWERIRESGLAAGDLTPGMSPRTAVATLAKRTDATTTAGLERLRELVELTRYGPPQLQPTPQRGHDFWVLKQTVVRGLRPGRHR